MKPTVAGALTILGLSLFALLFWPQISLSQVTVSVPVVVDQLSMRDPQTDPQMVPFRHFKLRVRGDPGLAATPLPGPPVLSTFQVRGTGEGDGDSGLITLQARKWKVYAQSLRYRRRRPRSDGVRRIVIRPVGDLVITAKGRNWPYRVTQPQQTIEVSLVVDGTQFCALVTDFSLNRSGLVKATNAPAPVSCGGTCGNAVVEAGEECDDGNADDNDACLNSCEKAVCGDGVVFAGVEACDDGNSLDGDGCDSNCLVEP